MARTISVTMTEIFLSLADPLASHGSDDPLTITKSGTIAASGLGIDGISGPAGTTWTIANSGLVSSEDGWGIALAGAGAVHNFALISGLAGGVEIGGRGLVTNSGTISGSGGPGGAGVTIGDGGMVANRDGGSIGGIGAGIEIGGFGVVANQGTVTGKAGPGVLLSDGGVVRNGEHGTIAAIGTGVAITGGHGTVVNRGSIGGQIAVDLGAGGEVTNHKGGSIAGSGGVLISGGGTVMNQGSISGPGLYGVEITGAPGVVVNQGSISGQNAVELTGGGEVTNHGAISGRIGVLLTGGGVVANDADGSISGFTGVTVIGGGTVTNQGTIGGQIGFGIDLAGGGVVTNLGAISGPVGVEITGAAGTVTNAGTITGNSHSVLFDAGATDGRLIVDPGAVFNGAAGATAGSNSTLELAHGTGTIGGIGNGQFVGFDTLTEDNHATWTLTGSNTVETVRNDGTMDVAGSLTVSTAVDPDSTGLFQLAGGATLEVAAALGVSSRMSFAAGSELAIDDFARFGQNVGTSHYAGSLLKNFGGSTIELKDFGIAGLSASYSKVSGLLQLSNAASQLATLDFQNQGVGAGSFQFKSDGAGGILITHT